MAINWFFPHTLSLRNRRLAMVGYFVVLILVVGGLIVYFGRQQEDNQGAAAQQENVEEKLDRTYSKNASKGTESGKLKKEEASIPHRPNQAKNIPADTPRGEKSGKYNNEAIVEVNDPAEQVLRTDLSEEERSAAIEDLELMDHSTIIETVTKALADENADVRANVLDALWEVDDEAVNTPILKALEDENVDVRKSAMDAMEQIESPKILPSLERALTDSDEDVREQALSILEDIPDHRAVDILIDNGLHSEDASIREDTLDSLEFITGQNFERREEATQWWDLNRSTFVFD